MQKARLTFHLSETESNDILRFNISEVFLFKYPAFAWTIERREPTAEPQLDAIEQLRSTAGYVKARMRYDETWIYLSLCEQPTQMQDATKRSVLYMLTVIARQGRIRSASLQLDTDEDPSEIIGPEPLFPLHHDDNRLVSGMLATLEIGWSNAHLLMDIVESIHKDPDEHGRIGEFDA